MKIKTSELEGVTLDWAVAQIDPICNGLEWKPKAESRLYVGFAMIDGVMQPCVYLSNGCCLSEKLGMQRNDVRAYSPSTDWSQGGPFITEHSESIEKGVEGYTSPHEPWYAESGVFWGIGPTPLIAACRAIVVAKLGYEVDVPDDLVSA